MSEVIRLRPLSARSQLALEGDRYRWFITKRRELENLFDDARERLDVPAAIYFDREMMRLGPKAECQQRQKIIACMKATILERSQAQAAG